jgi:hypothetical protein
VESSLEYFTRRAEEESVAAARARDPKAREVHANLAERYTALANMFAIIESEQAPRQAGRG